MSRQIWQYGTWTSPISPRSLAGALRLNDVQWDTTSDHLVWHEGRGAQGVLVAQGYPQAPRDLTTSELNVRAQVGERSGVVGSPQNQRLRRLLPGRTTNLPPPFVDSPM